MNRSILTVAILTLAAAFSFMRADAQNTPPVPPKATPAAYPLVVAGEDGKVTRFTQDEINKLARVKVTGSDHGKEAVFEGVALVDVLKLAGIEFGEKLRGPRLGHYLLVEASDKYRAVFALPEIDPGFTDKVIIIADRRDSKPLSAEEGPLRIIVPGEKRPARWVRQVIKLSIIKSP